MDSPNRVLQILDLPNEHSPIEGELNTGEIEFKSIHINSVKAFLREIADFQPDLVITDYFHPDFHGISALAQAKAAFPDIVFIVFTETISELDAIDCIKAGVSNIVNKDQISSMSMIVQEALKFQQARLEKRQIEEQLAKERETLSISLASIGEAIISIDLSGKIVLFNQAAQNITGYSSNEALDQPVNKVLHILDEKTNKTLTYPVKYLLEVENKVQKNLPYKRPVLLTKTLEKKLISGRITSILVDHKKHTGYVVIFDDVTQKELAAAQSMLSSKMESIGQLASGIAHEINTPIQYLGDNLNFISRTFETLKRMDLQQYLLIKKISDDLQNKSEVNLLFQSRITEEIDHLYTEVPRAVQESLEGIERVRKIVLAIREFSHPSQKINSLSDINRGILTTVTISKNEWKYYADLETDLDPNLPEIWCRIDEINQVLLNMIINAAHSIQEKNKLSSDEKGKIIIRSSKKIDHVTISISDTGCGIPENLINRIFDPFFTTKEVGKGTGQGLSLAHNIIVNHHHGTITVESTPNIGTTFTIELPISQEENDENREQ